MDYFKYLAITLTALVAIFILGERLFGGSPITGIALIGAMIGLFVYRAPARFSAGYVIWLASIFLWLKVCQSIVQFEATNFPQKYSPAELRNAQVFLWVIGILIFNPISYGFGRLISRLPSNRFRQAAGAPAPTHIELGQSTVISAAVTSKRRRILMLGFSGACLSVLFVGAAIEYLLHIPRLPYEGYVIVFALLAGSGSAWYVGSKSSSGRRDLTLAR